jgi:hypothetical protein
VLKALSLLIFAVQPKRKWWGGSLLSRLSISSLLTTHLTKFLTSECMQWIIKHLLLYAVSVTGISELKKSQESVFSTRPLPLL